MAAHSGIRAVERSFGVLPRQPRVVVVGATGAVGEVLTGLLAERQFPLASLQLLASERSVGKRVSFGERLVAVADVATFDFAEVDLAFFAAGGDMAASAGQRARAAGAIVIDKSSRYRMAAEVPLVVPEINGALLARVGRGAMVASPNCSTVQLVMVLAPLHRAFGVTRVNVATYQAVSGAGRPGIEALAQETAALLNGRPRGDNKVFAAQIAFNSVPRVERLGQDGFTTEEEKLIRETQRILDDTSVGIHPTCVRVPVFYGHGQAVHIELAGPASLDDIAAALAAMPGVRFEADPAVVPTPVDDAVGQDSVVVGRLRRDPTHPQGISLWSVADNTRKGAALNSVQIAEALL